MGVYPGKADSVLDHWHGCVHARTYHMLEYLRHLSRRQLLFALSLRRPLPGGGTRFWLTDINLLRYSDSGNVHCILFRSDLYSDEWPIHFRGKPARSEEHTSELQSLLRISAAVSFLQKKRTIFIDP